MKPKSDLKYPKVQVVDGYLVIPKGNTLLYSHTCYGDMVACVEPGTAEEESDQEHFDLYPLSSAEVHRSETWEFYDHFGAPTKEAVRINGELVIRKRAE